MIIYLNKILPIFLLPTGITLLLLFSGLLLRRSWLCWLGVAFLWLASTPLMGDGAMRVAERWQVRQPAASVPAADAIVVLSGAQVQPPGQDAPSEWNGAVDRYFAGVELYRAGKAPLLVFTGGSSPWYPTRRPEGEVLVESALAAGLSRRALLTTGPVVNTAEEAQAVATLLAGPRPQVILVASAFHMARATLLFAQAGMDVVPFPVDFQVSAGRRFTVLDALPDAGSLEKTETALREFYGLLFYWLFPSAELNSAPSPLPQP